MLRKISFAAIAVLVFNTLNAQDSTKTLSFSGSVDGYYRYNFAGKANNYTSFTNSQSSFELGMASLKADATAMSGKVGATVDLGFGRRAEEFSYNDGELNANKNGFLTLAAIKQAYITYAPSSKIKFTAGKFATHVGYELVDAPLNRNYSMSYMFTNGPFSHTGLKADVSLGGKSSFMIGVSNPTDYRTAPGMPKSVIAQFSTATKDDKLKLYLNFAGGKQNDTKKLVQGDLVATYALSSQFSIGVNSTMQAVQLKDSASNWNKSNWWGTALYLNVDPVSWFGLTLRAEYIGDDDEYLGLKNVFAPTLSGNFKIDNLTIVPEFRLDNAGNSVFYKNETDTTKSTGSFILAATYHF